MRAIASVFLTLTCGVTAHAQLMINEFNTGTPDYLELRNKSGVALDISGWTVKSWYSTGSSSAVTAEPFFTLPAGTVIPAGGHLVLQETGTPGSPGTLPNSMSQGFNYFWTDARTIEIAVVDGQGIGVDYVYLNWFGNPPKPNLPANLKWTGSLSSGLGDQVRRLGDDDTDDASDWVKDPGSGTPGVLNPGQTDCSFFTPYGTACSGSGGFLPVLAHEGCPGPGDSLGLALTGALGGAQSMFVFGANQAAVPIAGGCSLLVTPIALALPIPLGGSGPGAGSVLLFGTIPPGVPSGTRFTLQVFVQDGGGAGGFAATAGSELEVQ